MSKDTDRGVTLVRYRFVLGTDADQVEREARRPLDMDMGAPWERRDIVRGADWPPTYSSDRAPWYAHWRYALGSRYTTDGRGRK